MTIILSDETQKLLEERMKLTGISKPDEAVRGLLMEVGFLKQVDRSPETLTAIREGLADAKAGQGRPWVDFEREWMVRQGKR